MRPEAAEGEHGTRCVPEKKQPAASSPFILMRPEAAEGEERHEQHAERKNRCSSGKP